MYGQLKVSLILVLPPYHGGILPSHFSPHKLCHWQQHYLHKDTFYHYYCYQFYKVMTILPLEDFVQHLATHSGQGTVLSLILASSALFHKRSHSILSLISIGLLYCRSNIRSILTLYKTGPWSPDADVTSRQAFSSSNKSVFKLSLFLSSCHMVNAWNTVLHQLGVCWQ